MNRKVAGLLALAMLAACGGGGGNAGSITPAAPGPLSANFSSSPNGVHLTPFHGAAELANFEWGKAMLERMHYVAPGASAARSPSTYRFACAIRTGSQCTPSRPPIRNRRTSAAF